MLLSLFSRRKKVAPPSPSMPLLPLVAQGPRFADGATAPADGSRPAAFGPPIRLPADMTVAELRTRARSLGLTGYSRLTKAPLLELIMRSAES